MKKLYALILSIAFFAVACVGSEEEKKLEEAHALAKTKMAAIDSVYNQLVSNRVRTLTQRDSLLILAKSGNDSSYNMLRGNIRRYMDRQKIVIDSLGKSVEEHKAYIEGFNIPGEKRQSLRADQIGLESSYKKLSDQYKDLADQLIDLRKDATELRRFDDMMKDKKKGQK